MEDELILSEQDRARLDGIVQKMSFNKESDDAIQFVVGDFKKKYGVKKKEQTVSPQEPSRAKQESTASQLPSGPSAKVTPSRQPLRAPEIDFSRLSAAKADDTLPIPQVSKQEAQKNLAPYLSKEALEQSNRRVESGQLFSEGQRLTNEEARGLEIDRLKDVYSGLQGVGLWANAGGQFLNTIYPAALPGSDALNEYASNMNRAYLESIGIDRENTDKGFTEQSNFIDGAKKFGVDVANTLGLSAAAATLMGVGAPAAQALSAAEFGVSTQVPSGLSSLAQAARQTVSSNIVKNPFTFGLTGYAGSNMAWKEVKDDPNKSLSEKVAYSTFSGLSEMFTEAGFVGDFKLWNQSLMPSQSELAKKTFTDVLYDYTKDFRKQGLEEGTEEGINWSADLVWKLLSGDKLPSARSGWEAMAIGAVAPGAALTGQYAPTLADYAYGALPYTLPETGELKTLSDAKSRRNSILDDIENDNITDAERNILANALTDVDTEINKIRNEALEKRKDMSIEDMLSLGLIDAKIQGHINQFKAAKTGTAKTEIKNKVKALMQAKSEIETSYDTTQEAGLPSPIVEGETVVEAQPIEGAGAETPQAGGVLQVPVEEGVEEVTTNYEAEVSQIADLPIFQQVQEGNFIDINDANAAQEQILEAIGRISSMPESTEREASIELLTELFDEIDYYDNKTEITAENITERVPVGAPKRIERPKAERVDKLPLQERLQFAPVRVGDERYGAISMLEVQPDGNVDVVTYRRAAPEEIKQNKGEQWGDDIVRVEQRRVVDAFPRLSDIEYVESIFDDNGRIMGARVRKRTPLGEDVSAQTFVILNRTEEIAKMSKVRETAEDANLALDLAIQGQIEQLGDIPQYDFIQAYEKVTRTVETKRKVEPKKRPAKAEAKKQELTRDESDAKKNLEVLSIGGKLKGVSKKTSDVINRYLSVLFNLAPNVKLVVHYTQDSIDSTLVEEQRTGDTEGYYDAANNEIHILLEPTTDREISKNEFRVIRHEIIHPIIDALVAKDSLFANRLTNEIRNLVENAPDAISNTAAMRRMRVVLKSGDAKEIVTEFAAQFSDPELFDLLDQSPSFMDRVKNLINRILSHLGITKRIRNKKELLDFLTEMRNSFAAGKAVRLDKGALVRSALNKYQFSTREEKQTIIRRFMSDDTEVRVNIEDDIVPANEIQNLNPALSTVLPLIEKLSVKMKLPFVVVNDKKFNYASKVGFFNFPDLRTGTITDQMMPADAVEGFRKKGYNIPKGLKSDKYIVINAAARNVDQSIYGYSAVFIEMLKENSTNAFNAIMSSIVGAKRGADPIVNMAIDEYQQMMEIAKAEGLFGKLKGKKVYETVALNDKEISEALAYTALADAFQTYIRDNFNENLADINSVKQVVEAAKPELEEQLRPTPLTIQEFTVGSRLDDFANLLKSANEVPAFSDYKTQTIEEAKERIIAALKSKVDSKENSADAIEMGKVMDEQSVVFKTGSIVLNAPAITYAEEFYQSFGSKEYTYQAFGSPYNPGGYDGEYGSFEISIDALNKLKANAINQIASAVSFSNIGNLKSKDTERTLKNNPIFGKLAALIPDTEYVSTYIKTEKPILSKLSQELLNKVEADAKEGVLYIRKKGETEAVESSFHKIKLDGGSITDAATGKPLSSKQEADLLGLSENIVKIVGKIAVKTFQDPNYMQNGISEYLIPDFKESLESILDEIGYDSSMPIFKVKTVNGLGGYKVFESELGEDVSPETFFSEPRAVLDEYIKIASGTDNNLEKRLKDIESKGAVSIADLEMTIADMGGRVMTESGVYDRTLSFDYVWQFPEDYMGLDVVPDEFNGGEVIGKKTNLKRDGLNDTYTVNLKYDPTSNKITVAYESKIFKYQNVPPYLSAFPVFSKIVDNIPGIFPDVEYAALEFFAVGESLTHPLYEQFSEKVNSIIKNSKKDSKEYKAALNIQEKSHKFDERTDGARRIALNNNAYIRKVGHQFALKVHDETLIDDHYTSLGALYALPNKLYDKYNEFIDMEGNAPEPEEIERMLLQEFGAREVITLPEIEEKADAIGIDADEYVGEFISMFNAYGMRGETIFIPKIFTNLNSPTQFTKSAVQFSKRIKLSPLEESAEDVALDKVGKASYDSDKEYAERMKLLKDVQKSILSKNAWLDRQADIREALVDGSLDYAENLMTVRAGAQANATYLFNDAEKRIYKDLSRGEVEALDQIIFMRRVIQIDSNWDKRKEIAEGNLESFKEKMRIDIGAIDDLIKEEKNSPKPNKKFISELENDKMNIREQRDKLKDIASDYAERPKHPKGLNGEESIQAITAMERKLGATQFGKLNMRADAYFTEFRAVLKSYEVNGLIDEATYERFSKDDYEPRKFIEKIFEDLDDEVFQRAGTGLKQDVLKAIKEGSEGNLLMDSRMLLSLAYKSAESKRFQNIANAELASEITPDTADFAREANYIELPDGSVATDQYGNARVAPADKGFENVFYKERGKTRAFQLRNDMLEQWNDSNRSYFGAGSKLKKALSTLSGAPILRIFATGYNITFGFGLVVPESLAVILARGRVYGKDSFLPVALLKMAKDYSVGIYSKATDQDLVRDYFAHGGGMSFMSQEFRPEYRFREKYKNKLEYTLAKRWDSVAKGIAFTGETFEIGIRLAVYKRMIENLKQQFPDLAKTKDGIEKIKFMAAAEARNIVDFSKGGKLTKDLDAVAPYLNVAFQATMSTFNGIKDNPEKFASKFFQYAVGIMGLVFYNILTYGDDDDYEDIDPYMRYRYHIILLPTKDKDGNRQYVRLKKVQSLLPLTVPLEMLAHSWASVINGKPKKFTDDEIRLAWENAADGLPFFVPGIDKSFDLMNRIPAAAVIAKSVFNYDSFRNATIVPDYIFGTVKPYAESRASDRVEFFYKAIAKASESEFIPDISAPRLKAGVESIITSPTTNLLVGVGYGILDLAARAATDVLNVEDVDLSQKQSEEKAGVRITRELKGVKDNAQKVFVRSTNPNWKDYIRKQGADKEIKMEESTEDFMVSEKIKSLAKKHKEQGRFSENKKAYKEELDKVLSEVNPEKRERLGRKYSYAVLASESDKSLMSIRFADTQSEAARVFYDKFGKLEPEEFNDVMKDLREVGFRPNEEFYAVVRRLYTQKQNE